MKVKIFVILICFAFGAVSSGCFNSRKTVEHVQKLSNEGDSLSYALGVLFGKNIHSNVQSGGFSDINAEILANVIKEIFQGEEVLDMTLEDANMFVNEQYMKMQQMKFEKNQVAGREFLEKNKKSPGVVTLPSGLQYKIVTAGKGAKPTASDQVTVHYHGTLIDGTVFDSSVERGQPAVFGVTQVIQGWVEALQLMPVGSKWILYIPSNLAYGERQQGNLIEPYSTLIFEVELISINNN